jgi:uncharacterized protein (UPF0332 family)
MLCCLVFSGTSTSLYAAEASSVEVQALIEQARRSLEQARKAGHAWTITETYLADAEKNLADGEVEAAMAAAQRALLTSNKAVEQAGAERSAWQARVPTL